MPLISQRSLLGDVGYHDLEEPARYETHLEFVPQGLVVDFVVVLDLGGFDEGAEQARAAVGGGLLQVGKAALHVGAENLGDPVAERKSSIAV